MIRYYKARQAEPHLADGKPVNQLSGESPRYYPKYQGDERFVVEMIQEPEPYCLHARHM